MQGSESTGVVIIGRNEGDRLVRCLSSIKLTSHSIVYVDSGSTDGSVEAAEQKKAFVVRLDLTRPFTAGRARNEGFAALRALCPKIQYVQFVDGDCELIEGWIDAAQLFLESHKNAAVVCGRRRERNPDLSIYNRFCDIEWDTPIGEALSCGGDSLIRAGAFAAVGGFREELVAGEEPELCLRLRAAGWKIWRLDHEMTLHDAAMTRFSQWWRRTIRSGFGCAEVFWLHRASTVSVPKIYGKETASAIIWGAIIPLAMAVGSFIRPYLLGLAAIYPLQVCRIGVRRGPTNPESWTYALFMVVGKFAAFYGILKYWWRRSTGRGTDLIEYKRT
jgi:GT2 family glycosyltransferase